MVSGAIIGMHPISAALKIPINFGSQQVSAPELYVQAEYCSRQ